jgi:curved DNA-binding protein CbpA
VYAFDVARHGTERDYYATLGLGPDASEDEIRRTYRRLALQWHPDRNPGDARAEERFKEISEAYAILIDAGKRRAYDQGRRTGRPAGFGTSREDVFRDLFNDPRASAVFEELARELQRAGLRVDRRDFERTLYGGRVVVTGGVFVITPLTPLRLLWRVGRAALRAGAPTPPRALLGGRGPFARAVDLGRRLLGLGNDATTDVSASDVTFPLRLTAAEAERGGPRRVTLRRADGDDEVLVTIPAGVRRGTRLRLRGKGRTGRRGERGDAYLVVEVAGEGA